MIRFRLSRAFYPLIGLIAMGSAGVVLGQVESGAPSAPIDDSGSFEVDGVQVDVTGKTSEQAREAGWRLAQRKAWQMLSSRLGQGGGLVSDATLNGLVSGIVVEDENIGPNRYVARLGVTFSRARAGPMLGVAGGGFRSPPMVVLPLESTGGVVEAFEQDTAWRQAWARFRTGNSAVDYVRPTGTGPDLLLLNAGQAGRPGRGWWKAVLDQYGASDVLIPVVRLARQYPGGPIIGHFEARYGPDNRLAGSATLRVASADGIDALLDAGVQRIDAIYENALKGGLLRSDPGLAYQPAPTPSATPIDIGALPDLDAQAVAAAQGAQIDVQFDTPDAAAVNAGEAAMRAVPGVTSAATTSLAMGGVSVMRVSFAGDQGALAAQLQARGYQVQSGPGVLRIRRAAAPAPPPAPTEQKPG